MDKKRVYLIMCIAGIIFPYYYLAKMMMAGELDMMMFFTVPFANNVTGFLTMDLLVTALVVISFILYESKRLSIKTFWIPILAIFMVGVSLGLPLFLYIREDYIR